MNKIKKVGQPANEIFSKKIDRTGLRMLSTHDKLFQIDIIKTNYDLNLSKYSKDQLNQMGDVQALSWIVADMSDLGDSPARIASQVDHLQTGFSRTLE